LKIRKDLAVGAASHTGRVRSTNEDDYLLLAPEDRQRHVHLGRWFVVADGMGGVTGGAEASRLAIRALTALVLRHPQTEPSERMRLAFAAACQRVFASSRANPILRDMGTTMTAANLVDRELHIGHVGDSRCYLLRDGRLAQLTDDHTSSAEDHHLTRCIGGGRDHEQVDVMSVPLERGDTVLLATDGLWEAVPEAEIAQILRQGPPSEAAGRLVQTANARGGLDNATAVLFTVVDPADAGEVAEVDLPTDEPRELPAATARLRPLQHRSWPLWLAALALVVLVLAMLKIVFRIDAVEAASRWLAPARR
jgi:protein phosphatase